jgi:hypothetical protein
MCPESPRAKSIISRAVSSAATCSRPRTREQRLSGGREPYAATHPLEELGAEAILQPPDTARERGLGEAQPLRCPAEVTELGDRFEVPQVTQVELDRHSYRFHTLRH